MTTARHARLRLLLASALVLGTAACGGGGDESEAKDSGSSGGASASPEPSRQGESTHRPKVVATVADHLDTPWGVAFLPDKSALVSLRDSGEIKRIGTDGKVSDVGKVEGSVHAGDEGGLLGIAVPPDFDSKPMVYAYTTTADDNRIVRMTYSESAGLGKPEVVLKGIKKAGIHDGGALVFGPDKMLYAGTGDAEDRDSAQDDASLNGKVLRMTPDGKAPADNPTPGSLVYTKGHRNVQGLAFDDEKRLWASEFGKDKFDELNFIRPGDNYGWPLVEGVDGLDTYANPVRTWAPDDASCSGITWAGGSVWMACLKGERVWEIGTGLSIVEDKNPITTPPRDWFDGEYGRLRTIVPAPDGTLWLVTSNTDGRGTPKDGDDKILKVEMGDIHVVE